MIALQRSVWVLSGVLSPVVAEAHGVGALYNLPVPLWLYNWTAATVLVVSFVVLALVVKGGRRVTGQGRDISARAGVRLLSRLMPLLRLISVSLLLLCIATGFWGNPDPLRNFAPVFLWIIVALVLTYMVALIGDVYAAINPFRVLSDALQRIWPAYCRRRCSYPRHWGDWPALLFYLCFIWLELFGTGTPRSVSVFLLGYTLLNIIGVGLIGSRDWFTYCEFFSVFFRLVARLAPVDYQRAVEGQGGHLRLRMPLSGLLSDRPAQLSTVIFILAMLSTTAFDGLKATQWWVQLFWADPTGLIESMTGRPPSQAIWAVMPWYIAWETLWLLVLPLLYWLVFTGVLGLGRGLTRVQRSVSALALDFAYTLLPIVLTYHITHYWTLILTHGLKILSLISDPFGWRWDLFGTAMTFRAPIIPDMGFVWHSQVVLIVLGHVASVWMAHRVALRVFPSRASSLFSQLPVLLLMILFTVFGLWILAQPLTAMRLG